MQTLSLKITRETPGEDGTICVHAECAEAVMVNHDVTVEKSSLFCRPVESANPAESAKPPPTFVYMVEKTDTTLEYTGNHYGPYHDVEDTEKFGPFKDIETANARAKAEHQSNIDEKGAVAKVENIADEDEDGEGSNLEHSSSVDDNGLFHGRIEDNYAEAESYTVNVVKQQMQ